MVVEIVSSRCVCVCMYVSVIGCFSPALSPLPFFSLSAFLSSLSLFPSLSGYRRHNRHSARYFKRKFAPLAGTHTHTLSLSRTRTTIFHTHTHTQTCTQAIFIFIRFSPHTLLLCVLVYRHVVGVCIYVCMCVYMFV